MITAQPGLPEFDYVKPSSLEEASKFLAEKQGEARPFLGGTDVFVRMRDGIWKERYLVDVKHLDGTDQIQYSLNEGLSLGAGVNMNRVISSLEVRDCYPLLAEACKSVASYQLRTRATVVGNICNASPAGDTIGACLAFDGVLTVHGIDGFRQEPLATFFLGPGKTRLKPGDIVTAMRLPTPAEGSVGRYIKLGRNNLSDLAIVGVTVLAHPDPSLPSGYRFRVALASVAPVPLVVQQAEELLAEGPVNEYSLRAAANLAQEGCHPIDDVRGSARYRKAMVRNLTFKALTSVWERLGG